MHLIDKPRLKVLSKRRHSAAEPDVLAIGGFGCAGQGGVNPTVDKMKDGAAVHGDGRARMVGEDEDGSVIRRVVAPPPLPSVVGPRSANRPEHVSTENPGSDIGETSRRRPVPSSAETSGCRRTIDATR